MDETLSAKVDSLELLIDALFFFVFANTEVGPLEVGETELVIRSPMAADRDIWGNTIASSTAILDASKNVGTIRQGQSILFKIGFTDSDEYDWQTRYITHADYSITYKENGNQRSGGIGTVVIE